MPIRLPALWNQRDPWREGRHASGSPPDLEDIVSNFFKKHFGGQGGRRGRPSSSPESGPVIPASLFKTMLLLLVCLWGLSGIYVVQQADEGVVLRFGAYVRTVGPGLHWIPRFIEQRIVKNVEQVSQFSYVAQMLTKDENIVSVEMSVQYRIDDLRNYLFNVKNPLLSLQEATASALRQVVGQTTLDELLTTGREAVREEITEQLKKILAIYQPGLLVTKVSLQPAKPPEEVTDAFNDAIKAREDEQRYINQANAYVSNVLPIAQGKAVRKVKAANAFAKQVVLLAQGDTARFLALLPEYSRAPQVMRERMYLTTLEGVLSKATKVLVDVKGSNNMMYLPLDQLLNRHPIHAEAQPAQLAIDAADAHLKVRVPRASQPQASSASVQRYSHGTAYNRGYGHAKG